jgi:hypothetical protein
MQEKKKKKMNSLVTTAGFVFCWLATAASMCAPPVNVLNRVAPFSPTLFATPPPTSCVGLATGLYNITIRGYSVIELWCQSNKAFLVLPPRTANDTNYSENDGVRTFICAVRLDPQTLLVDVADLTFAQPIANVGFASAYECRSSSARSTFNVDLHGTVFQLANDTEIFAYGWNLGNASSISASFKVANGSVGGFCSGTYTGPHRIVVGFVTLTPPADMAGETFCYNLQWSLRLALDVPSVAGAVLAPPCSLPANLTGSLTCNATLRDSPPPPAASLCPPLPMCTPPVSSRAALFSPSLFATQPPTSCVGLTTGLYNITIRGNAVVELWCQTNKAFLLLPPRTSNNIGINYSEIDGVRTYFCAVRLDPETLLVDVGDLTFADPIPILPKVPVVFASAAECRGRAGVFSFFNVDLRGTVFQLANDTTVTTFGWNPSNSSAISEGNKVLNARVYGFCGGSYLGPRTIIGYENASSPRGGGPEVYCKNLQWRLSLMVDAPGALLAPPCNLPSNLTGNLTCNAALRDSPPPLSSSVCPPIPTTEAPPTTTLTASAASSQSSAAAASSASLQLQSRAGDDGGDNSGAIIGGVVGAVLIVAVVAILGWFVVRALVPGKQQQQAADDDEEPSPSSTQDDVDLRASTAREPPQPRATKRAAASQQYSSRPAVSPSQSSPYGALSREEVGATTN